MSTKKKRILPAWMRGPTDSTSTAQPAPSSSSAIKSPKVNQSLSAHRHLNDTLSDDEADEGQGNSNEITYSPKRNGVVNGGTSSNNSPQNNSPKDLLPIYTDAKADAGSSSPTLRRSVTPDSVSATSSVNTPIIVTNGTNSPATRKSCMYGSSCYRKNPQHRTDFAHPGDTDYSDPATAASTSQNTVGSPSNDSRPLCEYGTACYRKNPQHQRDFRHDGPQKRKARPTDLQDIPSDNDGDFDASFGSDDYKPGFSESDDSFVTSDSMNSGDSDFDPEDEEENEKNAKKRKKKVKQANKKRAKKD